MEAAVIDKISAWSKDAAERIGAETQGEALFIPPGASLQRAEQFATAPRFHRHAYSTERLADFVAYTLKIAKGLPNDSEHLPTAYVTPDGSGAQVVFDHGSQANPLWGNHSATLKLKQTAAWEAAQRIGAGQHTQQAVIDWLEDWSGFITAHAAEGAEIEHRRAIASLRRVKLEAKAASVSVEGDFARNRSTLESIEASGDGEALPAYFVLHSPLYAGTVEHDIFMRLGVRDGNNGPALALRIVGKERLQEETSAWVEQQLTEQLADALAGVYVGALKIGQP